jgi:hypothetical protein
MTSNKKALIYMGSNPTPITVDVEKVTGYSPYTMVIKATNGTVYETHLSNVLFITKNDEKEE